MEKRIFISHSSKDSDIANNICAALEESGLKCWIAPRDIPYSSVWAGEIAKAIKNSSAFLFLSSNSSNLSDHVSREIQLAVENGIAIIPIHLDNTQYNDANKYYLATIHCMVEYNAAKVQKLVEDIAKLIPSQKEEEEEKPKEEKENNTKKEKKEKKQSYTFNMILCGILCVILALIGSGVFFLTDINPIFRYLIAVASAALAVLPLLICRSKTMKKHCINKSRVNTITVVSLILSIVMVMGGYCINYNNWYNNMDDKYHITITAPEDMSAADFITATEAVLDRLEIFAGETKYTAKVDGDKIDIIVPRELFKGENPENIMQCYFTRAMKFYVTLPKLNWGENTEDYPQQVLVTDDDIESAEIKFGTLEGVDPAPLGTEATEYEYIEVVLKKDFYDKNSETFDEYGESLCIAMDKEDFTSFWYFDTKRENNILYLLNDDPFDNANETILHNLTHEPLKTSLYYKIDIAPVFEKIEETDNPGELQCNADKIKGDYVTFVLEANYDDIDEGEWLNTVNGIKKRLDAIGMPYAYGTTEDNPFSAVIKTGTERMGISIMQLLAAKSLKLMADFTETSIYDSSNEFTLSANDSVAPSLTITPDSYYAEKYKGIAALADSSESKKLWLATDSGLKIFSYAPEFDQDTSAITFNEVVLTGNTKLDESTMWIAELTKAIFDTNKATYLTFSEYEFSNSDISEKNFGINLNIDELKKAVKEINPDALVGHSKGTLNIELMLPVDENLPEKLIEAGKTIYQSFDFENSMFDTIAIYAIDEIKEERARIFFSKYISSFSESEYFKNGYIYVYGIFSGGRIQRDHDRFIELIYSDEYYKQFIHEENGRKSFS